jgi:hypothetical protein
VDTSIGGQPAPSGRTFLLRGAVLAAVDQARSELLASVAAP